MADTLKTTFTRGEIRRAILTGNKTVYFAFYRMNEHNISVISAYELSILGGRMV